MIASGAFTCDIQGDYRWYLDGYPLRQAHAGLPDVTIVSPAEVTGLETAAGRVTGVRVRAGQAEEPLPATVPPPGSSERMPLIRQGRG